MLSYDAGVGSSGFCEKPSEPWRSLESDHANRRGKVLASLSDTILATRFLSWQGRSGKSYVFTVYAASDCPAFCDAVLIAATRDRAGRRRVLAALDTGAFPEPTLAGVVRDFRRRPDPLEFHIHLLTRSQEDRRDTIADLVAELIPGGKDGLLQQSDEGP